MSAGRRPGRAGRPADDLEDVPIRSSVNRSGRPATEGGRGIRTAQGYMTEPEPTHVRFSDMWKCLIPHSLRFPDSPQKVSHGFCRYVNYPGKAGAGIEHGRVLAHIFIGHTCEIPLSCGV
jgi:hypothetical protein